MRHFGLSHAGKVRENNEDAWTVVDFDNGARLHIVSDGVGGHAGGETASRIVVETLPLLLEENVGQTPSPDIMDQALKRSLIQLSRVMEQQSRGIPGLGGLAATVVCCLTHGHKALVGHMGDSRCYLLRGEILSLLTKDHTVARMLLDLGEIALEEFRSHPGQARLTRAVGSPHEPLPDVHSLELQPGDRLLLSSDGLHGLVEDDVLADICKPPAPLDQACEQLIQAALDAGGRDNVTALLVEV